MSILNALWKSFFSRPLYLEVFTHWRGFGLLYLLTLSCIQTVISTSQLDARIHILIRDKSPALLQQLPTLTLKEGRMFTPEDRPYSIYSDTQKKRLVLIDTSLDEAPADLGDTPVFVGKTQLTYLNAFQKPQVFDFAIAQDMVLDQKRIIAWLTFISDWAALLMFPILWLVQSFFLLLQTLFFSIFTYTNFKTAPFPASYPSILRLTSVALTPTVFFSLLMGILMVQSFWSSFLYVLLAVGYVSYACNSVKNPEDKNSHQDSDL
jgi:hypothetical protein